MDLFKLVGSVMVDTDQADKSLSKTDEKAEGLGKKFLKGAGTVAKWGTAAVGAAAAVGTAMIASAKSSAENLDVIDKASQRMGVSAESYQELAHAAELCGVEMSTMEKAAKKLEGTDLSFDDALDQIYALGTAEERAAKASELFGESVAYQMTPMLNASVEDMDAMKQEARDLGLVMSEDAVKSGAEMNDAFTKIDETINTVKNQIGLAFMPLIQDLLNWVVEHMPEIQAWIGKAIQWISELVQKVREYMPQIKETLKGMFDFVKEIIDAIAPLIEALMPIVKAVFDYIGNMWNTVLKPILLGIIEFLTGVFTGDWEKIFQGLADIVQGIFGSIVEFVKAPINGIIELLNIAIDGFNKIKIPDWVPGVGGKGLDIPHIPMLANGGDITQSGTVLVGEQGPEFLNLPKGARVTPLDQASGIDYDKLANAIVSAMQTVAPQLIKVVPDEANIFSLVCEQQQYALNSGRTGIMV